MLRCTGDRTGRTVNGEKTGFVLYLRLRARAFVNGGIECYLVGAADVSECRSTGLSWCGVPWDNTFDQEMKFDVFEQAV